MLRDLKRSRGEDQARLEKWLETVLVFPFEQTTFSTTPIADRINSVRQAMNRRVLGHTNAKEHILDYVFERSRPSSSCANIIGLQGPPGNGKSTLLSCLAEGLGMPVCKTNLNGVANAGHLFGVPKGIVGAGPGYLVQEMIRLGSCAPIFLFEELDKLSKDHGGVDVASKLMALTDSLATRHLTDEFLEGIQINCAQSLIIFTFNDKSAISPILRGRMQVIKTEEFDMAQRRKIFDRHMLPPTAQSHGFTSETLKFGKAARNYLLDTYPEGEMKQVSLHLNSLLARAAREQAMGRLKNVVHVKVAENSDGGRKLLLSSDPIY